ncbi:hypothetical protein [Paraburkholderia aromaticivorans]|uniref:hypothetical protein n=1 Tax=Paraburkholderia aromaticivorans TaxID=2026199 RepID=UPI0014561494|nr:hypothetical protein [Paraburkholderia aromaticivorans]
MSVTSSTASQPSPYVGEEQHAGTTIRVVDQNQLPNANGSNNNVATEFKLNPNGQMPIQIGSQVVPPPPHDPSNDEGIGEVIWRGFKEGFGHPGSFFSEADGMGKAEEKGEEYTPEQFDADRNRGAEWDDLLANLPIVGEAIQGAQTGTNGIDAFRGKPAEIVPPFTPHDPAKGHGNKEPSS